MTVCGISATAISIADNPTEILIGEAEKMTCSFTPNNVTEKTLEWYSDNAEVLTVSADGTVTANNIGTATVVARHGKLSDSLKIRVKPVEVTAVKIVSAKDKEADSNLKLKAGDRIKLSAEIHPENATYKDIVWSVDDENIAEIDKEGLLTAKKSGSVKVTATAKNQVKAEKDITISSGVGESVTGLCGLLCIFGFIVYFVKKKKRAKQKV